MSWGASSCWTQATRLRVHAAALPHVFEMFYQGADPRSATQTGLGIGLALAKQLLQDTSLPLAQIAFAAGFGSVEGFTRAYTRAYGHPPSATPTGSARCTSGRAHTYIMSALAA